MARDNKTSPRLCREWPRIRRMVQAPVTDLNEPIKRKGDCVLTHTSNRVCEQQHNTIWRWEHVQGRGYVGIDYVSDCCGRTGTLERGCLVLSGDGRAYMVKRVPVQGRPMA